ncbi:hypothetical protein ACH4S8_04030 [Streptomyces sp. NPDC021080]|uniref:hypothetical protein n=1 Tax=Streptomyces sp. NPDC021080 TaxID=3365110 RepID=UPI0037A4CA2E
MTPWSSESLSSCAFVDPYAVETRNPCVVESRDLYAVETRDGHGADTRDSAWTAAPRPRDEADTLLSPPDPAHRLSYTIDPRDQRRLDLHATLTAAGVPPMPEDRAAIDQISALPADVNEVLQRWLHHTV